MWADILGQMTKEWIMSFMKMGQSTGGGDILGQLSGWVGGLFGGGGGYGGAMSGAPTLSPYSAKGNVFGPQGHMTAFARGGIVDRPTIFPFAAGVGLMGEKGAEGILPLGRTASGELGVKGNVEAGKNATVNFNIYAIDTQSGTDFLMNNASAIAGAVRDELDSGNTGLIGSMRMVR